jgi:hypothetical protein
MKCYVNENNSYFITALTVWGYILLKELFLTENKCKRNAAVSCLPVSDCDAAQWLGFDFKKRGLFLSTVKGLLGSKLIFLLFQHRNSN